MIVPQPPFLISSIRSWRFRGRSAEVRALPPRTPQSRWRNSLTRQTCSASQSFLYFFFSTSYFQSDASFPSSSVLTRAWRVVKVREPIVRTTMSNVTSSPHGPDGVTKARRHSLQSINQRRDFSKGKN